MSKLLNLTTEDCVAYLSQTSCLDIVEYNLNKFLNKIIEHMSTKQCVEYLSNADCATALEDFNDEEEESNIIDSIILSCAEERFEMIPLMRASKRLKDKAKEVLRSWRARLQTETLKNWMVFV